MRNNQFHLSLIWLFLTGLLATSAQAEPVKCPPFSNNMALSAVSVYDGPPEEMANLAPDSTKTKGKLFTANWTVGDIYDAGRQMHLVCKYATAASLTIRVEKKVHMCVFRSNVPNQPGEMICK